LFFVIVVVLVVVVVVVVVVVMAMVIVVILFVFVAVTMTTRVEHTIWHDIHHGSNLPLAVKIRHPVCRVPPASLPPLGRSMLRKPAIAFKEA